MAHKMQGRLPLNSRGGIRSSRPAEMTGRPKFPRKRASWHPTPPRPGGGHRKLTFAVSPLIQRLFRCHNQACPFRNAYVRVMKNPIGFVGPVLWLVPKKRYKTGTTIHQPVPPAVDRTRPPSTNPPPDAPNRHIS